MIRSVAILVLLLAPLPAYACSISLDVPIYQPGGPTAGSKPDYAHLPDLPPLKARVISVVRANPELECDNLAEFTVEVSWDQPTTLSLSDFGFYFRPMQPLSVFSSMWNVPVQGKSSGTAVLVKIYVHDAAVKHHDAIDITTEIFAVNAIAQLGPASTFVLHADADKQ